jgi:arylamine N-acetyltransferase
VTIDVDAYLARLGVEREPPSVDALARLHRAHVERIAYEALDVQLERPTSIEPEASAARITGRGRGGYCYHLNGAFSALLRALGYEVEWHRAGVQTKRDSEPPGPVRANHLVLTVTGLPDDDGAWMVDAGLGDALYDPLPLRAGTYVQGPFTFGLRASDVVPGGWRFEHDAGGSFLGADWDPRPATVADFLERHAWLESSPESGFVRTCAVQRRDAGGVDDLTGLVLERRDGAGAPGRTLETPAEWYGAIGDVFGLALTDLDGPARDALWRRVHAAHEAWLAA